MSHRRHLINAWALALLLPTGWLLADNPPPAPAPVFEEWNLTLLDGKPCGYSSTITTQRTETGTVQYLTTHHEEFSLKRLGTTMTVNTTSKIVEDAQGVVLSFSQQTAGAGSDVICNGIRVDDDIIVFSHGVQQRYHVPRLSALGPQAIQELTEKVPLQPGQTYSFSTFAAEYPQGPVIVSGKIEGQEDHAVNGQTRKLWKMTQSSSMEPGLTSTSWVDDQANDVDSVETIPGIGEFHELVSDRTTCLQPMEGAEIFATNMIYPSQSLENPGRLQSVVYHISSDELTRKFDLCSDATQHVTTNPDGSVQVEVDSIPVVPAAITWQLPHPATPELNPYLGASAYLEVDSPQIQALAREAVAGEKNPVLAAHKIEAFVRAYITKKDLNVGFASAGETARSREGDCTEHSVLCAALGRAVGLPTRCVVGLGYLPPSLESGVTGVFGFHMWAEAWVGPNLWVPMDAALDGFDVGHIAIVKTALTETNPEVDLDAPVISLMQKIKIDVVKINGQDVKPVASTAELPPQE